MPRQEMRWKGLITDVAGTILAPCTLVNISATGAKLILKAPVDLPDSFILMLSKHGSVRRQCEVVWRAELEIGVQFIVSQTAPYEATSFIDDTLARIGTKN